MSCNSCVLPTSALSKWRSHKTSWKYVPPPGKDFVALNRAAVESGLTTAEQQQHYRATHDIRIKPRKLEEKGGLNLPEDMVFGISTR